MVPRSRLIVFGTITALLLALGCKGQNPAGTDGTGETGVSSKRSAAPAKGPSVNGALVFPAGTSADKAAVKLLDENLKTYTSVGGSTADKDGKFLLKPVPAGAYFVLAEAGGKKMATVVVVETGKADPDVRLSAASTVTVAGIQPLFATGANFQLNEISLPLYTNLVAAVEAARPTVDLALDVSAQGPGFKTLYDSNTDVKKAYDEFFGDLQKKFATRNPGKATPSPGGPVKGATPTPGTNGTPDPAGSSTFASVPPTPTPSPTPPPTPTPAPTPTPTPTPEPTGTPTATPVPTPTPTPTPVPTPTPPLLLNINKVDVTDQVAGVPVKVDASSGTGIFHMQSVDLAVVQFLIVPDGNQLWIVDNTGTWQRLQLGPLLGGKTVASVLGCAVSGTKIFMMGNVDGTPSLITVNVESASPPNYTATASAIVGTSPPTVFGGHALRGTQLFFSDPGNHRIYQVDLSQPATPPFSLFAGTGSSEPINATTPAGSASMGRPNGLAITNNTLWVAEDLNHRILRCDLTTGDFSVYSGRQAGLNMINGPSGLAEYSRPCTLMLDAGKLIATDRSHGAVREIDIAKDWVAAFTTSALAAANGSGLEPNLRGCGRLGTTTYVIKADGTLCKLTP